MSSQANNALISASTRSHFVSSRHGRLHVVESTAITTTATTSSVDPPALVLVHGNSSCSSIFRHILHSSHPLLCSLRRLAVDLPGHGQSEDASDPNAGYTQRGYAEAVLDALRELAVESYVLIGWSLGGHIGIEALGLLEAAVPDAGEVSTIKCRGLMIVGSPPANGPEQVAEGFDPNDDAQARESARTAHEDGEEHMNLAGTEVWPDEMYADFVFEGAGRPHEQWMVDAAKRTDGRARRIMWESFEGGRGLDQRAMLARCRVPCAVVNGAAEPFINLPLLDRLEYGNLWERTCHRMKAPNGRGLGHTPFWEEPTIFEGYLKRFLADVLQVDLQGAHLTHV